MTQICPAAASDDIQVGTGDPRPLILVALSGGGWYRETLRLLQAFDPQRARIAYAYGIHRHHGCADLPTPLPGPRYPVHYLGRTHGKPWRHLVNLLWLGRGFLDACRLMRKLRPDAVLAVGTAIALPLFAAARLFGVRCLFLESVTRVRRLSRTGQWLRRLGLVDRLYVQWPALADAYPNTCFAGAVL